MKKFQFIGFLCLTFLAASVSADGGVKQVKAAIAKRLPNVEIDSVKKSPVDGLYEVISGSQVVYMTKDAVFMIDGDMVDLKTKRNHTEEAKGQRRLSKLDALGEGKMLVYTPEKTNHTVTIVTDIDCPYCRRLHDEMGRYLDYGVKVRYVFMPLKGRGDMDKTVSVWCSDDRNTSLDIVKAGGEIDSKQCDNPIRQHLKLARNIGVRGTPAIILENGTMLPGYVPIEKLIHELRKI